MRLGWVKLVAVLGGISLGPTASPAPSLEAWRTTDLDLRVAKLFISNPQCESSPKYLESCVRAATAVGIQVNLAEAEHFDFEGALLAAEKALPIGFPKQAMYGAAINTHLQTFDAHASLSPTDTGPVTKPSPGFGFLTGRDTAGLRVQEVLENTPAARAGIEFGDVISSAALEGQDALDLGHASREEIDELFARGAPLQLTLRRESRTFSLRVVPEIITHENVRMKIIAGNPQVAMIRIGEFEDGKTCAQVRERLIRAKALGIKRFGLDLRGNPGGPLDESLCTAGLFAGWQNLIGTKYIGTAIPEKDLVQTFNTSPNLSWRGGYFAETSAPLVILIDGATASAAEVLAGTLQLLKVAWLVGDLSFGKGSVQTVNTLPGHRSLTLAATTALYYFPNLRSNQALGISPSFLVPARYGEGLGESVAREAQLFPNALPATSEPWQDPRQVEIQALENCISRSHSDILAASSLQPGEMGLDYQQAYSIAVLKSLSDENAVNCRESQL